MHFRPLAIMISEIILYHIMLKVLTEEGMELASYFFFGGLHTAHWQPALCRASFTISSICSFVDPCSGQPTTFIISPSGKRMQMHLAIVECPYDLYDRITQMQQPASTLMHIAIGTSQWCQPHMDGFHHAQAIREEEI